MAGNGGAEPAIPAGYELNLADRTAVRSIGPEVESPQTKNFVRIEITDVHNPRKIPLSFIVHYRSETGEESSLGTFGLFPPDNPGTFIVATRGSLRIGGDVVVSLVPLEEVEERDVIRVELERISFIEGGAADSAR